ncbi:MAG: thiol reductant ABC exporter subunit CydD [Anaerolineaceae bacterium]|nr:thiol reductant ABC exporter subunit CydD [Anaerolineaceae bacterium]
MLPAHPARKRSLDQRLLYETRFAHGALAASLGANALLGFVVIAQAALLSQVIQRVFLGGETLEQVLPTLLFLLGIVGLRAALSYASGHASAQLAIRVKNALRERFVAHLYALGPAYRQGERSGDLVLSVTEGIEKLDGYYRDYLPGIFSAIFLPLVILLVVLPLDLVTFAVLLVTAPLIPFFMALIGMAAGALAKRQYFEMRHLGAHFLDVMQGLTTLKLFNRSQYQAETIQRITGDFREATMRVLRVAFLSAFTLEMLATLSVAIVAVEIGVRLLNGGIGFEQALFLLVIAPEFYLPLRALGAKFHNATEGKAAAERLYAVLDTPLPEKSSMDALPVPPALRIRFEGVSLAYADDTRPALKDVSFEIEPGQRAALVGASGGGKTSIAALLLRFVQPNSGRISVGGSDLARISAGAWREHIAWVSQSPYLFNATIAENICFSRPDASETQMITAAQAAGVHDFVMQLPLGYETVCGERGLRLSGGQAQRIALARALLRDAPLLILDEPTSQLDPESEAAIIRALERVTAGRTVLLITHRLSTAVHADKIILMAGGRVIEQGSHAALMAAGGRYAHLVNSDEGFSDES